MDIDALDIKYNEDGLVPAIIQDANNGQVLMLAYMNSESLAKTIETGITHFGVEVGKNYGKKVKHLETSRK